jgi:hypothetical protein
MMKKLAYDDKKSFLAKIEELMKSGISANDISLVTPYHVHEVEEILNLKPSKLRFFALLGALSGTIIGFAVTIYTALDWPLITSGKPLISIPPFIIIAFALTILSGSLVSFAGFLILSKLPDVHGITSGEDSENQFVILIDKEDA